MSEVGNTVQKHGQLPLELRISFLEKEDGDDDPPQGWKRAGQWGQVSESESRTDDPSRAGWSSWPKEEPNTLAALCKEHRKDMDKKRYHET